MAGTAGPIKERGTCSRDDCPFSRDIERLEARQAEHERQATDWRISVAAIESRLEEIAGQLGALLKDFAGNGKPGWRELQNRFVAVEREVVGDDDKRGLRALVRRHDVVFKLIVWASSIVGSATILGLVALGARVLVEYLKAH